MLGSEYVTPYEVLFKLFSVITIIHGLIIAPLWPAYSDAYQRGHLDWIRSSIKQQIKIGFLLFLITLIIAATGKFLVNLWIGDEIKVSSNLYYLFALFIILSTWSNIFACFVNAINRITVQLYSSILAALINIPLSIYFVNQVGLGLEGIILATIISLSIFSIVGPIQAFKILKEKAS
jgi:O-antigen/teichoic acid export membrane protein